MSNLKRTLINVFTQLHKSIPKCKQWCKKMQNHMDIFIDEMVAIDHGDPFKLEASFF